MKNPKHLAAIKIQLVKKYNEFLQTTNTPTSKQFFIYAGISRKRIRTLFGNYTNFIHYAKNVKVEECLPQNIRSVENKTVAVNPQNGNFIFDFTHDRDIGARIEIPVNTVNIWQKAYQGGGLSHGLSVEQIANKYNVSKLIVTRVLQHLKITKNLQLTDSEIEKIEEGEKIEAILKARDDERIKEAQDLFVTAKNIQKQYAKNWLLAQQTDWNPVIEFLKSWTPNFNGIEKDKVKSNQSNNTNETFCVCLSDLHYGAFAEKEKLYEDVAEAIEETCEVMKAYLEWIKDLVEKRSISTHKVVIFGLGDIIDSINRETDKRTQLDTFPSGLTVWKTAFESLFEFCLGLSEIFDHIEIHAVGGNHSKIGDTTLFSTLIIALTLIGAVDADSCSVVDSRWSNVQIDDTLVVFEHGYSSRYNIKLPKNAEKKEAIINNVFLKTKTKREVKNRIYLTADQHSIETSTGSLDNFFYIRVGSISNITQFVNELGFKTSKNQTCFLVTEGSKDIQVFHAFFN